MDDLEKLRRLLDEAPPPPEAREKLLRALRAEYDDSAATPPRAGVRIMASAAVIVVVTVAALLALQGGQAAAWSPVPVTPPDPALVAAASAECGHDRIDFGSPLLIDQREDVAVAMFGSPSDGVEGFLTCTLVLDQGVWRDAETSGLPFRLLSVSGSFDEELLGDDVARIVIETGTQIVDVSHQDGFYLIWWPEDEALAGETMRFLADNGSTLLELPVLESENR